jgi:PAS domain S-box-containing protein
MSAPNTPYGPELYESIVRQSVEAIIFADRDGVIRIWNRGSEALFGFTANEAVGRSLDIIIPERLRQAHWEGFRAAMERGQTRHGGQIRMTRAVHRDGGKLYVDMSFAVVIGRDGSAIGSLAVARDASTKRELEAALRTCRDAIDQLSRRD